MHISPLSSEHLLIRCAQEEPGSPQQTVILLEGRIDEYCRLEALPAHVEGDCILDLGGVQFINSVGLRKWIQMMRGFAGRVDRLRLRGCPEVLVRHLACVVDALGAAEVESFHAPYDCEECGHEATLLLQLAENAALLGQGDMPGADCPACAGPLVPALPRHYFTAFLPQSSTIAPTPGEPDARL
jgi:hypothetical protein